MQANNTTRQQNATHKGRAVVVLPAKRAMAQFGIKRVCVRYADGTMATLLYKHLVFA